MDNLLTIHDLAAVLKVSPKTLQNRQPEDLPPSIILPGTAKARRWRQQDVTQWLAGLPVAHGVTVAHIRSGRPRRKI